MRIVLALIYACLMCGCGTNVWHGDTSFTPQERDAIESGDAWLAERIGASPHIIIWDLDLSPDDDAPMYSIRSGVVSEPPIAMQSHHRIRFDRARFDALYELDDRLRYYRMCAAHEFGHEAGMHHHDGPGLMNPSPEIDARWTMQDIVECRRSGVCD